MINELRSLYGNKKKKGPKAPLCEQILGTNTVRNAFAEFWQINGQDLMIVVASRIHEWETDNVYTSEEKAHYLKGIASIGTFFEDCWNEREVIRLKEEAEAAKIET